MIHNTFNIQKNFSENCTQCKTYAIIEAIIIHNNSIFYNIVYNNYNNHYN